MSSNYRKAAFEYHGRQCAWCEGTENIEVHHRDGDRNNNQEDNLLPLCHDCHVRLHREGLGGYEDELLPVSERSHIDDSKTTFSLQIEEETWEAWKATVPRNKSLQTRIIELIEADAEGRVVEQQEDESDDE